MKNRLDLFVQAMLISSTLILWEVGVACDQISPIFFPPPSVILKTYTNSILSGELLVDLYVTICRFLLGALLGTSVALLFGYAMGWSDRLRVVIDPLIAALHPLPKIALLPLVMIVFGVGEAPKVILIALAAFFPLLINTMAGVRQINSRYFEVAKSYGASSAKVFWRIVLPGSIPMVLTGTRLAINSAFVITIAVELLTANTGVGAHIWEAWQTLRVDELYVSLITTALLGVCFNWILQRIERKAVHLYY